MKHISLIIIMTVATALLAGTVPAAAQQGNNTAVVDLEEFKDDECQSPEAINPNLVLCSTDYEDGTAILRFKADSLTRIRLTDSGAFMRGGNVPQRDVILRPDEVNTVRWDVVEYEGNAGVGVNHDDGLYSIPLEDPFVFVGGPWSSSDVQLTAITAAASVGIGSVMVVLRGLLGRDQEPERIA